MRIPAIISILIFGLAMAHLFGATTDRPIAGMERTGNRGTERLYKTDCEAFPSSSSHLRHATFTTPVGEVTKGCWTRIQRATFTFYSDGEYTVGDVEEYSPFYGE